MKRKTEITQVADYGLYQIVRETKPDGKVDLFMMVGTHWMGMFMKININAFWHDIAEWKAQA